MPGSTQRSRLDIFKTKIDNKQYQSVDAITQAYRKVNNEARSNASRVSSQLRLHTANGGTLTSGRGRQLASALSAAELTMKALAEGGAIYTAYINERNRLEDVARERNKAVTRIQATYRGYAVRAKDAQHEQREQAQQETAAAQAASIDDATETVSADAVASLSDEHNQTSPLPFMPLLRDATPQELAQMSSQAERNQSEGAQSRVESAMVIAVPEGGLARAMGQPSNIPSPVAGGAWSDFPEITTRSFAIEQMVTKGDVRASSTVKTRASFNASTFILPIVSGVLGAAITWGTGHTADNVFTTAAVGVAVAASTLLLGKVVEAWTPRRAKHAQNVPSVAVEAPVKALQAGPTTSLEVVNVTQPAAAGLEAVAQNENSAWTNLLRSSLYAGQGNERFEAVRWFVSNQWENRLHQPVFRQPMLLTDAPAAALTADIRLQEALQAREHAEAATKIQAFVRGHQARAQVAVLKQAQQVVNAPQPGVLDADRDVTEPSLGIAPGTATLAATSSPQSLVATGPHSSAHRGVTPSLSPVFEDQDGYQTDDTASEAGSIDAFLSWPSAQPTVQVEPLTIRIPQTASGDAVITSSLVAGRRRSSSLSTDLGGSGSDISGAGTSQPRGRAVSLDGTNSPLPQSPVAAGQSLHSPAQPVAGVTPTSGLGQRTSSQSSLPTTHGSGAADQDSNQHGDSASEAGSGASIRSPLRPSSPAPVAPNVASNQPVDLDPDVDLSAFFAELEAIETGENRDQTVAGQLLDEGQDGHGGNAPYSPGADVDEDGNGRQPDITVNDSVDTHVVNGCVAWAIQYPALLAGLTGLAVALAVVAGAAALTAASLASFGVAPVVAAAAVLGGGAAIASYGFFRNKPPQEPVASAEVNHERTEDAAGVGL